MKIIIELKSDTLIGSGEGYGDIIDSDIVFDDLGIPYIPAKRIKGCLRESAHEVCMMLESSALTSILDLKKYTNDNTKYEIVEKIFGSPGQDEPAPVYFSNLTIDDYEKNRLFLKYLAEEFPRVITKGGILSTFTVIRQQTAIDDESGVAKEHSLRTVRLIRKGEIFKGNVQVKGDNNFVTLMALACTNLRGIGTKRKRGYGEVECNLLNKGNIIPIKKLEDLCRV
ncbi:MAG: CRISPR-associated protein [wastewater metagenome]|nr:CRISPR-associated protein [Candidatus Loosdrechtia aerotolerans]